MLADFLDTFAPLRRAKAEQALTMPVCLNGGAVLRRHEIVEARVAAGAFVSEHRGAPILRNPDASWLDVRNITATGIAYARFLIERSEAGRSIAERLAARGIRHERDAMTDTDYRHVLVDAHGNVLGRFDAHEACKLLAAMLPERAA